MIMSSSSTKMRIAAKFVTTSTMSPSHILVVHTIVTATAILEVDITILKINIDLTAQASFFIQYSLVRKKDDYISVCSLLTIAYIKKIRQYLRIKYNMSSV